ncbi:DUF3326 domain-containing protein [filamentous cyanobacterium LEGE 11480]|uniref:DUF3326 domain-containing protein n=1 Tax=Romeriopsis navalis LEGE 11480 TaxID=2777977 RepID=A0A928VSM6_9CYAN|nr:DUF3326 domain-containing protein [Romeriopsis navalis]MBE9031359.1 DUF3326 domain-containing protein [Romeriopsis navalis LEGE 11480]
MLIENQIYRFSLEQEGLSWLERVSRWMEQHLDTDMYPLRFAIVEVEDHEVTLEITMLKAGPDSPYTKRLHTLEILNPRQKAFQATPFGVVQIVPTGIRCEIGGFAGDAGPATNLLAATADFLVTHPNAVNASELNEMAANVLYVEGKALDDFLLGYVGLQQVVSNKIGTFVDVSGIDYLDEVVNTLNAGMAVKGIDCGNYMLLKEELGVKIGWSANGCAVGTVLRPEAILEAVDGLIAHGATAIGGVSVIHGVTQAMFAQHLQGKMPNPSGGVEAIITHLISKVFRVPTAHAPLPYYQDVKEKGTDNPRASAEFISTPHYFCVLKGLARAPQLSLLSDLSAPPPHLITVNNIGAVIVPASCLGGVPALAAEYSNIPLIAVRDNQTILNVTNDKMRMNNVIEVDSYLEAAGVVVALREGISLASVRRPINCARQVF